ncbi:uncharacterized protein LOC143190401 [Rhynchophorus ferrugineus]|uniref:Kazal-like domain-containing protein n=1 Tax=Rhynchophorus ferrugineus TaxID=354439 RepID=A0A834IFP3_RHYFE|nr:hypothetical protein GWI33_008754 [Rhynchophorus ferrugineus]
MQSFIFGCLIILLNTNFIMCRSFPIDHINTDNTGPLERVKRQFGPFQQNDDRIFFDNDYQFNDFLLPNWQNNLFQNNMRLRTTPSLPESTTVAIPGMGTTVSACESRCLTTPQYNPVCGDNNITYFNIEKYRCAVKCGRNVRIVANRACPRTR